MSPQRPPDFDDLVGEDVPPADRDRLRAAHDLLVQAGPPPELSPELEAVPWPDDALAPLGLRRRAPERKRAWTWYAAAAAAIALVGFLLGQTTGTKSTTSINATGKVVKMHGTALAPHAQASIELGQRAPDGNWAMLVSVLNLPPVPNGGYYDLWLSRHGKPVALCGSFNTQGGVETIVRMSAAYSLKKIDGWVVTRESPGVSTRQLVMTT